METKIPFYNILNVFLLGLLFIMGVTYILFPSLVACIKNNDDLVQQLAQWQFPLSLFAIGVIYEIGLIINRISSVLVEAAFEKLNLIPKKEKNYSAFNLVRKDHPFLYTLSREYGFSRGNLTLWLILTIVFLCNKYLVEGFFSVLLTTLFFFSMRKFSYKIQHIIASHKKVK